MRGGKLIEAVGAAAAARPEVRRGVASIPYILLLSSYARGLTSLVETEHPETFLAD